MWYFEIALSLAFAALSFAAIGAGALWLDRYHEPERESLTTDLEP